MIEGASTAAEVEPEVPVEPDKKPDKVKGSAKILTAGEKESQIERSIRRQEEQSLKEFLDEIGTQGAYRTMIRRTHPKMVSINGKQVEVEGFCETTEDRPDEEYLQREWGGGTFQLSISRRQDNGSFTYAKHRTVKIAGSPRLDRLPNVEASAAPAVQAPSPEGGMVKEVVNILRHELDKKDNAPRGIDPMVQAILDTNNRQLAARDRELADLRTEMSSFRNQKPEPDPLKDHMLKSLMDGNSGQVEALRLRHESELRMLKEGHVTEVNRIQDRHDRTIADLTTRHDMALATLRNSLEREIASMRSTSEVIGAAGQASHNVQVTTLQSDIKRLERDNDALRQDVKDLRDKKEKSMFDMLSEVEKLKEVIGVGDGGEKSVWDRLAELASTPGAIEGIAGMVRGGGAPAKPVTVQAVPTAPTRPVVVRNRATGDRFVKQPDGQMVPVVKKPKIVTQEDGSQLEIPEIEREKIDIVVGYLERAFAGNQDPVVVAQSARPLVPQEIMAWIQQNDSEQTNGVDLFLSKVAKLPGSSPLSAQSGRNWVRKVGKALVSG